MKSKWEKIKINKNIQTRNMFNKESSELEHGNVTHQWKQVQFSLQTLRKETIEDTKVPHTHLSRFSTRIPGYIVPLLVLSTPVGWLVVAYTETTLSVLIRNKTLKLQSSQNSISGINIFVYLEVLTKCFRDGFHVVSMLLSMSFSKLVSSKISVGTISSSSQ